MAAANIKSTISFGESRRESGKKPGNDLLIARFNSLTEAQRAQKVLTIFGYPEDVVRVTELSHIAPKGRNSPNASQPASTQVIKSSVIFVGSLLIALASHVVSSIFSTAEIGMMVLVSITLTAGGAVICFYIGEAVWRLINSEDLDWDLEAVKPVKILINVRLITRIEQMLKDGRHQRGKFWISVRLKAPDDAKIIQRTWRNIAPNRPEIWVIKAKG